MGSALEVINSVFGGILLAMSKKKSPTFQEGESGATGSMGFFYGGKG